MGDINHDTSRAVASRMERPANTTLVTPRVATSDDYTDRDGRKVERTDWHTVACP